MVSSLGRAFSGPLFYYLAGPLRGSVGEGKFKMLEKKE